MLRVRLLGELAIEADGEPPEPPASRRARAPLAWLALHPETRAAAALSPERRRARAR
jgi:DNA-binding SARP family transcriptional activator